MGVISILTVPLQIHLPQFEAYKEVGSPEPWGPAPKRETWNTWLLTAHWLNSGCEPNGRASFCLLSVKLLFLTCFVSATYGHLCNGTNRTSDDTSASFQIADVPFQ